MAEDAEVLARAAGLQRAWQDHRKDVADAIASVQKLRAGFAAPRDPAAEPMPPYAAPKAPGK